LTEMLGDGVRLMLLGMVVVFSLLSLLVLAVKAMSLLALSIEGPAAVRNVPHTEAPHVENSELVAAVTAAIHAHRKGSNS
jgi:sodium pump decarboxylase gamma subunit